MPHTSNQDKYSERTQLFSDLLREGAIQRVQELIGDLHATDIAHVLESLPRESRIQLWDLLEPENEGEVLLEVNDGVRKSLIADTDSSELFAATQNLEPDDLADIIPDLPNDVSTKLLQSIDKQHRRRLATVMSFPEDTAGGLMNTDTITVRADISLDVVLRYLRFRGKIPEMTDNLIVINRKDQYLGTLAITDLLVKNPHLLVSEFLSTDIASISADISAHEVAQIFEKRDLISAPVVDESNKLLGRITIDDVVDVIREEADHSIMSMAGLTEEDDMFAPVIASSRRRTVWLGLNLLTAVLASWVIGNFKETIEQLVALAVLMPIVASMGGIAGSQTLTLVIRGIALGQISRSSARSLLHKEILIGALNGCIWAIIVALIAYFWFDNLTLSVIIAAAILINLVVAALAGATIPIILDKLGIDPALAGGVVLTTVTDVVGFMVFLGMAAVYLV